MMGEEGTLMKRRRHTPEQVIRKLREAERMLLAVTVNTATGKLTVTTRKTTIKPPHRHKH
jgi:hypothetical protein